MRWSGEAVWSPYTGRLACFQGTVFFFLVPNYINQPPSSGLIGSGGGGGGEGGCAYVRLRLRMRLHVRLRMRLCLRLCLWVGVHGEWK